METYELYAIVIALIIILIVTSSERPRNECIGLRDAWRSFSLSICKLNAGSYDKAQYLAAIINKMKSVNVSELLIKHVEYARGVIAGSTSLSEWLDNADIIAEKLCVDPHLMNDYIKSTYNYMSNRSSKIELAMAMRYADRIADEICINRGLFISKRTQRDFAKALMFALGIHWVISL